MFPQPPKGRQSAAVSRSASTNSIPMPSKSYVLDPNRLDESKLDQTVQIEYFSNEKSFRGRLQLYLLQNQRTSFIFRMVNILIKLFTCFLYVFREIGDCHHYERLANGSSIKSCNESAMFVIRPTIGFDSEVKIGRIEYEQLFFVERSPTLWAIQTLAAVVSLFFTITHMYVHHKGNLIHTLMGQFFLIELITSFPFLISIFVADARNWFVPTFLNIWIAKVAFQNALRDLNRSVNRSKSILGEQLTLLVATLGCIFFMGSCGMTHLQRAGLQKFTLFESFYFIVVTFSTVGYGDYKPDYWMSQFYMIIMIALALLVLPVQIEQIAHTLSERKKAGGTYSEARAAREKHVILSMVELKAEIVEEFLLEFYAHYRLRNYFVILMSPEEMDHETKLLLQIPSWQQRVIYMRGSVLKNADLERARILEAEACFVLSTRNSHSKTDTDQHTILRSWSVKDFAPNVKQYVMIFRPESKMHVKHADYVVCEDEFKYALLANNCICPGISTFITLLLHTSRGTEGQTSDDPWHRLYGHHSGNEVYAVQLGESKFFGEFDGKSFTYASFQAHRKYGVSLVGVKKQHPRATIELNPGRSHILNKTDTCYYISITREELIRFKEPPTSGGKKVAATIAGMGTLAMDLPTNKPSESAVDENGKGFAQKLAQQFRKHTVSESGSPRIELQSNSNTKKEDTRPLLTVDSTQNNARRKSIEEVDKPHCNSENPLNDVPEQPVNVDTPDEAEAEEETCELCDGVCVENIYTKSFLPVTPYVGTSATLCYLVYPRRPLCCLDLTEACEHSKNCKANDYAWRNRAIILAANHASNGLYNFIVPLRAHYRDVHDLNPLVLLLEKAPDPAFIDAIAWFPMVYYMIGSFDNLTNQLRAGINHADYVVVVNKEHIDAYGDSEYAADSNTIISVQTASRLFPNVHIITELSYWSNMRFMQFNPRDIYALEQSKVEQKERNAGSNMSYMFRIPFATGKVFSASMLDTLLYQAYAKPYLVTFVRLLLGIDQAVGSGYLDAVSRETGIQPIRITENDLWIRTYGRLYQKLCSSESNIPIGLFRTLNIRKATQTRKESDINNMQDYQVVVHMPDGSRKNSKERKFTCRYLTNERQEISNLVRYRMETIGLDEHDYNNKEAKRGNVSYVIINPAQDLLLHENDIVYVLRVNRTISDVTRQKRRQRNQSRMAKPASRTTTPVKTTTTTAPVVTEAEPVVAAAAADDVPRNNGAVPPAMTAAADSSLILDASRVQQHTNDLQHKVLIEVTPDVDDVPADDQYATIEPIDGDTGMVK